METVTLKTTATETITHANCELHERRYLVKYSSLNGAQPSTVEIAVHTPRPDGGYEQAGYAKLADSRLVLNLNAAVADEAYTQITADIRTILETLKESHEYGK